LILIFTIGIIVLFAACPAEGMFALAATLGQ
jgi:hypothetical protein